MNKTQTRNRKRKRETQEEMERVFLSKRIEIERAVAENLQRDAYIEDPKWNILQQELLDQANALTRKWQHFEIDDDTYDREYEKIDDKSKKLGNVTKKVFEEMKQVHGEPVFRQLPTTRLQELRKRAKEVVKKELGSENGVRGVDRA